MRTSTLWACIVLLFSYFYFTQGTDYIARHYAYPLEYREVVEATASEYKVPYELVAGVILAESKFKHDAQSSPGAVGLMQLMPDTAHWIAEQLNQPTMTDADITEPTTNIKLGTWYLAYLLDEFKGNKILALAAYNAGRGHVEDWMKQYGWDYDFSDISKIPFPETRDYVKNVLANEQKYKELYTATP